MFSYSVLPKIQPLVTGETYNSIKATLLAARDDFGGGLNRIFLDSETLTSTLRKQIEYVAKAEHLSIRFRKTKKGTELIFLTPIQKRRQRGGREDDIQKVCDTVYQTLTRKPDLSRGEIAEETKLHPDSVSKALKNLVEQKRVAKLGNSPRFRYSAS